MLSSSTWWRARFFWLCVVGFKNQRYLNKCGSIVLTRLLTELRAKWIQIDDLHVKFGYILNTMTSSYLQTWTWVPTVSALPTTYLHMDTGDLMNDKYNSNSHIVKKNKTICNCHISRVHLCLYSDLQKFYFAVHDLTSSLSCGPTSHKNITNHKK